MTDDRELSIKFRKEFSGSDFSHWVAIMEFDGEQVYEETAPTLRDAGDRIYRHVWEDRSIIPNPYRYEQNYQNTF